MLAEIEVTKTRDMNTTGTVFLDPDQKSPRAQDFEERLSARIVGQERAVRRMSGLYQIFLAGMNPPNRPIGTMLFLGPTGSGKTRVIEAAAKGGAAIAALQASDTVKEATAAPGVSTSASAGAEVATKPTRSTPSSRAAAWTSAVARGSADPEAASTTGCPGRHPASQSR